MKSKIVGLLICFGMMLGMATAQQNQQDQQKETAVFKLKGDQGECQPLNKAVEEGDGIVSTDYKWMDKSLEVTFDPNQTSLEQIESKLADAGYVRAGEAKEHEKKAEKEQEEARQDQEEKKEIAMQCTITEEPGK